MLSTARLPVGVQCFQGDHSRYEGGGSGGGGARTPSTGESPEKKTNFLLWVIVPAVVLATIGYVAGENDVMTTALFIEGAGLGVFAYIATQTFMWRMLKFIFFSKR
jgi:hypothetical protein